MRMDIFKELSYDAKLKAMNEFLMIYGVEQFINDGEMTSVSELMERFECGLYEDGHICPSDDLNKLGDLLNDLVKDRSDANAKILQSAVENAMGVLDEYTQPDGDEAFKWLCFSMDCLGVMFDDVGNVVYVDKVICK